MDSKPERYELLKETQLIAGLGCYVLNIPEDTWTSSELLDRIFGINEAYERTIDGWIALIHPDDRATMLDYFTSEVLGQRKAFAREYRIIRHDDGAERWIRGSGRLEFDAMGRPEKMTGTIQDITECKLTEIALRESEKRRNLLEHQNIVQTSLDGYWVVSAADARILEVNDAYCRMIGYSQQELLNMCISDLEAVESHDETAQHIRQVMQSGYDRFETVHRHKLGHLINIEASVSYSAQCGGRMYAFIRDNTERYRADELRRQSLEEIDSLYNQAACGYHSLDKDGVIVRINDTELAWLGYSRDEVVGKMKFADLLSAAACRAFWQQYPKFRQSGFLRDLETEIIRKDKTILLGLLNSTAVYDMAGNFVMCRTTLVDITERKRLEETVSRRNADLTALTSHIQDVAEAERAHLARELHDEMGSILTGLSMEVGRLCGAVKDPALVQDLTRIRELITAASRIKQNIINQLYPTVLEDYGFVHAVGHLVKEYRKYSGIEVELLMPAEDIEMEHSFALAAYRITQECLTNIAKHAEASHVWIEAKTCDGFLNLTIRDDGKGMPSSISVNRHGIFGMIERARYLGGSMEVRGEAGAGTVAHIRLPQAAMPKIKKRVLVVDDHAIVRNAVRQLLESQAEDFSMDGEAADAKSAIRMAVEGEWDIVLLDVSLPDMSGIKVLEEVKKAKPGLPVIMLSSHAAEEYGRIASEKGAACYIEKGETEKLIEAMRQAVR